MPRKNNPKKEPHSHKATIYDENYKAECYGCVFVGRDFKCLTSDGECLKSKTDKGGIAGNLKTENQAS
jgi:hypothetical protein